KALGSAWYLPEERNLTTTDQMLDEMSAALGGRAAEELTFNKLSTGALNDLERITKQAYAMVAYFGMSEKLRNVSFYDSSGQQELSFTKPYSEKTAELIDKEVQDIVEKAYKKAYDILDKHKEQLKQLAERLLDKELIFAEDLEDILGPQVSTDESKKRLIEESKKVKKIHEDSAKKSGKQKEQDEGKDDKKKDITKKKKEEAKNPGDNNEEEDKKQKPTNVSAKNNKTKGDGDNNQEK
ncbi:MAG: hypothetical protein ACLFT6_04680, partial [Bacteroidales bacterium]